MHLHMLPINCNDLSLVNISNSWDLEWEQWLLSWSFEFSKLVDVSFYFITFDEKVVWAEFTIEASHDHNLIFGQLTHSSSLSSCDHAIKVTTWVNYNSFPFIVKVCQWKLHPFKWGRVLFICILDTSKYVYELVVEICAGVVVSSFIYLSEFHPFINLSIKDFYSGLGLIYFFSWPWYQNISISNWAARMTMSGKFHFLFIFKLKLEIGIISKIYELTTLEHAVWEGLVITSSNHKTFWFFDSTLYHLEIMWEVASEINLLVG